MSTQAAVSRYYLAGSIVLFVLIWWAVAELVHNPFAVASPQTTLSDFVRWFTVPVLTSQLATAVATTLGSILLGFGLSVVVGVPLGILMGRFLAVDLFFEPWVNSWYSVPAIAFVPLTMNWTGVTWVSAMITAFLVAVFSITINVYTGVKNCSRSLMESALAYGATQRQVMSKVILPASLPNSMTGLRLGISRAVEGVTIAEMVFTVVGLGGMIDASADKLELALSDSLILVLALICIALSQGMKLVEARAVAWKEVQAMSQS
jgi:ABC-type nitrate/sulfonate/bicarbonate transport system permease component